MKYNLGNLRKIPENASFNLRTSSAYTFILVEQSGEISFANTAGGKDDILKQKTSDDALIMVWEGQYRSDVFALTEEDLKRHYPNSVNPTFSD